MFKMYPLQLSNINECMIKIETKGDVVIGKFYSLVNENTDKNDVKNRYHDIPFYVKKLHKSVYPEQDFVDWVNVFCKLCEEEHEDENVSDKMDKLEGEEKQKLVDRMTKSFSTNEYIISQLKSSREDRKYISTYEEFEASLEEYVKEDEVKRKEIFSSKENLIEKLIAYLEEHGNTDIFIPIEVATELIGLVGINPLLKWIETGKLISRGNKNKTVLLSSLIDLIKNDKEVQQYILEVNELNQFCEFDVNVDKLD